MVDPLLAELNAAAERIWLASHETCPALDIEVRPEIDSTNTALMARGRRGDTSPALLTAVHQTAGRGRQGRVWTAEPGATLTFSLGLPLRLDAVPGGGSALSLAVGLAVAQALDHGLSAWSQSTHTTTAPLSPIGLKWPNDLYLGRRKLGGILIEATPAPNLDANQRWVVIGIGLNVRSAPPGAASLLEALNGLSEPDAANEQAAPGIGEVWSWLAPSLIDATRAFEAQGFAPLQAAYAQRDVLRGHPVSLWTSPGALPPPASSASLPESPSPDQTGEAQGVDAQGALLVQTAQGLRHWTTGEVSVRWQAS
jgi:BirA family biotin operon repressor/biotin-[acetyl-CoA-carboxylase] ligase